MALIPSLVSNVPTVSAGTSGLLGSAAAAEAAPQPRVPVAVELSASLRAGMEGVLQSTQVTGQLADPGPAAVGRFATVRRATPPPTRNAGGDGRAGARDKDSLLELFAEARPDAGRGVGRLSGGLSRAGRRRSRGGQERVGRFQPKILPRPPKATIQAARSPIEEAFAGGIGRVRASVGRLSGALGATVRGGLGR